MIDIRIEPAQYQYDIQSLVQAFYPGHVFRINDNLEESYRILKVFYKSNRIEIQLYSNEEKLFEEYDTCDYKERRETKNILKKLLYNILSKDTNLQLPWGNLTGIRPAKIPALMLEAGVGEDDILKHMKQTYMISDEKLKLSFEIAKRESKLLSTINYKKGYSLYVGIPFCPTTCLYCSFTSFPISVYENKCDGYIDAVIKELVFLGKALEGRELNTVYIGGGTPTTLSPFQLEKLILAIKDNFDFSTVREFTVEAGRPDSITRDKLMTLKTLGVSRISINPQTMNQQTLDLIGRRHTVEQVKEAFSLARECGFNNINMDFIVGLPGENESMVRYSMEEAIKLQPESITVHSLAIKRASRLNIEKDNYESMPMDNSTSFMQVTEEYARMMEMKPYYLYRQKNTMGNQENVGYSKEGCEGLYNILMMGDYQDIWAVGAGAVSKILSHDRLEGKRIDAVKNVDQYIDRIDEMISRKQKYFENLESMGC